MTADRSVDRFYDVVALQVPIAFNKWGDHDHNGLMFALEENREALEGYRERFGRLSDEERVRDPVYPLVRPLVLRVCEGEWVKIRFTNLIRDGHVGIHLIGDEYDVRDSDVAWVGENPSSLTLSGETRDYVWHCQYEGVFVFHDAGNLSGMQRGTNLHGLFGALVVDPCGTVWREPEGGEYARAACATGERKQGWGGDGLYVDVIPAGARDVPEERTPWLDRPVKYPEGCPNEASKRGGRRKSFREYVTFFHDEVEFLPSHERHVQDVCHDVPDLFGRLPREHAEHPLMTISYRAEPMVGRQQEIWKRLQGGGPKLLAPVVHEEQHHSSWLFGDPATPVLKAYIGDPVRIRLVHTAVKETHVFHLHLYSWHHDYNNVCSPIIDAISIGPQTGHTIVPLWGAGNRQGATGDIIWHCHLYPHFHEGMWGLFRTFDRLQDGSQRYPDDSSIQRLLPLPDRMAPTAPTPDDPGFPNFIDGDYLQRSPLPPWIDEHVPENLDYRPSEKEQARLNALVDIDEVSLLCRELMHSWRQPLDVQLCEAEFSRLCEFCFRRIFDECGEVDTKPYARAIEKVEQMAFCVRPFTDLSQDCS